MAIKFSKERGVFSLHTTNSTYQMKIGKYGHMLHLYYGKPIDGEMDYLLSFRDRGFSGNPYDAGIDRTYSMDVLPQEFPTEGTGDFRQTCLSIKNSDGSYASDFRYRSHKIVNGKYSIPGLPASYASEEEAQTLQVYLLDASSKIEIVLQYGILSDKDIITRSVIVNNKSGGQCEIHRIMSTCIDFLSGNYEWINFHGRHAMEQNVGRMKINHSIQSIGSKRGASSHQYNPFIIIAEEKTTEDNGDCYGASFVYSGSFKAEVERDQYNQTRVTMGLNDEGFVYNLNPNEAFYSPEVIMSYSDLGLTQLSHNFHEVIRNNVCRGKYKTLPRPVLINNWEATYFDFDKDKIVNIAKQAASLGVEMFVLDDGWFGKRDSDNSGLGDLKVNEVKLGGTLKSLVEKINGLGLKFGLWFEPEMISEDSHLFREHPDWAFTIPGRKPIRSRNQFVLDLTRKEVVDYIFESMCDILDNAHIEYIKWDFNRSITDVFSSKENQSHGALLHDYMLGLYSLLERLIKRYPNMLIESCSGGGGRFDAGMLHYSPQIWASDNTDAIDRIRIQEGYSYGYPISTIGSHVSAVPNHQTGRITPFETRGVVAMSGSFGYELDLAKITENDKKSVKTQIKTYQDFWNLIHNGKYYRLSQNSSNKDYAAWQYVSKDLREALVTIVTLSSHGNPLSFYVKLKGLSPKTLYKDMKTNISYYGSDLMQGGFPIPLMSNEYSSIQVHFSSY